MMMMKKLVEINSNCNLHSDSIISINKNTHDNMNISSSSPTKLGDSFFTLHSLPYSRLFPSAPYFPSPHFATLHRPFNLIFPTVLDGKRSLVWRCLIQQLENSIKHSTKTAFSSVTYTRGGSGREEGEARWGEAV